MLSRNFQTLSKSDLKLRDTEKLLYAISTFTNILRELTPLANKHGIEGNLYYSDVIPKIYQRLGDRRLTWFLSSISEEEPNEKETLLKHLKFLEKEETSAAKTDHQQFKEWQSRSIIKIIQKQREEGIILLTQPQRTTLSHLWWISQIFRAYCNFWSWRFKDNPIFHL